MGRGAWQATVLGVTKSQTGLRDYTATMSLGGGFLEEVTFVLDLQGLLTDSY